MMWASYREVVEVMLELNWGRSALEGPGSRMFKLFRLEVSVLRTILD